MTNSSTKVDPWIGRTIAGEFLILKRIGAGGMGSVYLAEQVGMDRQVVVKVILANLSHDTDVVTRFRREAKTIARLRHPNIVQVFTSGETEDGGLYLAMEYVPGRTLGQELKRSGTMVDDRIVHIAKQIAAALAAAHEAKIVHRDLKPANVILTPHPGNPDHVIVLDFGIAKVLEEPRGQTKLTQTGWMMGTPAYMAPEQIASRPVDGRTDIYTLGVMLYEMATGANPFDAETPIECMMKHLNEPPTPTHERFPELGVSPALEACIQQCLEKSPSHRFATAEALLERLRAIESRTAPIRYAPTSRQPVKSGPRRVLVLTAICLALIAAGAAFFSLSNRDEPAVVTDTASQELSAEETAESPDPSATSSPAALANSADPSDAGASVNPESALSNPGSDAEANDEPKPPRTTPTVASQYSTPQSGSVYRQSTTPNPVGYRPAGQQVAATPPVYPLQPTVHPSQTPPVQRPAVQLPPVQQPVVERPDPAPEPLPEAEPVLEPDGPFGSPLISGARMESQLGSMTHYRSRVPFEDVVGLYEDEFRDSRVMMARHGEGLEEYLAIMDSRDEFGFNMIRIQPEADGTTKLIFFSD